MNSKRRKGLGWPSVYSLCSMVRTVSLPALLRPSGARSANATEETPGIAATRSTIACWVRVVRSGSGVLALR